MKGNLIFSKEATNVCVPDVKTLQGKLIELENFIVKQINEKNNLQLKYSKVLDIGTKLSQNESLNNSHLDNIKTLNERIYDLTDENRFLREQLDKFKPCDQSNLNGDAREYTTLMKDTQKDNVFINNYSKEEKEDLIDNYKTLEHRICSLESEVKQSNIGVLF